MRLVALENAGAQHGSQCQRHEARDQDCNGDRGGELAEHAADDATHEEDGYENGDKRQRDRDDGEADLARARERRFERLHPFFDMADDVLQHHDGVVDDEAHRQGQGEQGDVVDRVAEDVHRRERADERYGQRERRDKGRRQ